MLLTILLGCATKESTTATPSSDTEKTSDTLSETETPSTEDNSEQDDTVYTLRFGFELASDHIFTLTFKEMADELLESSDGQTLSSRFMKTLHWVAKRKMFDAVMLGDT